MPLFDLLCWFGLALSLVGFLTLALLQLRKTKGWRYSGLLESLTANEAKAAITALILISCGFGIMFFSAAFIWK